eukprot:950112-Prorocentrum_minimum.AAC.1
MGPHPQGGGSHGMPAHGAGGGGAGKGHGPEFAPFGEGGSDESDEDGEEGPRGIPKRHRLAAEGNPPRGGRIDPQVRKMLASWEIQKKAANARLASWEIQKK